jgi:hypothetical protein
MTYDEAYQKIVQTISEIQSQTSPDILYSVVTQAHKQVEELYGWILLQRFEKEKQETEKGVTNVEVVQ